MANRNSALPHQSHYQLSCECVSCTYWNVEQGGINITCAEKRCVCDEEVNLEVFRVSYTSDGAIAYRGYYRCARRLCGYNLKAFSPNLEQHERILTHARDYLLAHRKVRCGCGKLASYDISYVEELESLQLFFICRDKRCSMKYSMLDVVTREKRGVRCMCVGTNLQLRETCVLIDDRIYQCPNANDPDKNCGFSCHRLDSFTFIHCKQTEADLLDSPYQAFPRRPKICCSKPTRLKFKYNKEYTDGQLGYACSNKKCDIFIKDILWVY